MSEKIIEREYEAAFANVASTNPVFPYRSKSTGPRYTVRSARTHLSLYIVTTQ